MYAIVPPFAGTFQQVARGTYAKNSEVARSMNGLYSLIYQSDGNLVLYKLSYANGPLSSAIWATNSYYTQAGGQANFQWNDGNIALYKSNGSGGTVAYWSGGALSGSINAIWILQDDGNFVGFRSWSVSHPNITGSNPYAATATDGGKKSNFFGRLNIL